jgi:hypothetical protein
LGAVLGLAIATLAACELLPVPADDATRVLPAARLPPSYAFTSIADTLRERSLDLSIPTAEEARAATVSPAAFAAQVADRMGEQYGDVSVVSVHVAVVDSRIERLPIDHVLAYAVETTGHETGNCIDLVDASTGEALVAACFLPTRPVP